MQGSDGTKYYLRVMPTTRDPDGNGTAKELEEESVALGSGTCNGHESGTGRQNHIKLDLVDEQFIEKVAMHDNYVIYRGVFIQMCPLFGG